VPQGRNAAVTLKRWRSAFPEADAGVSAASVLASCYSGKPECVSRLDQGCYVLSGLARSLSVVRSARTTGPRSAKTIGLALPASASPVKQQSVTRNSQRDS
jgi:hypothetical protein